MKKIYKPLLLVSSMLMAFSTSAKTLDILWWSDGPEGEVLQAIANEYSKQKGGDVDFNIINVAYNDIEIKLKSMITAGKPPALSRIGAPNRFANFAVPLNDKINPNDFFETLQPYYMLNGQINGAPMDVTANGMIYNKTIFDKAGIAVPTSPDAVWTWEEFEKALEQAKEKGGARYGMVVDFTPHRYSTILYQFGGAITSEDGKKTVFNSPESLAALTQFKSLHDKDLMPKSVWLGSENPNTLFRSGTVAAHLSGSWMLGNYKDVTNFEWGVTYLPKGTQRSSVPGGKYIMAFKDSGSEQEAVDFITYLSSKDVNERYARESLFLSPRVDNQSIDYAFGKEMMATFAQELAATGQQPAKDWSNTEVTPKIEGIIKQVVSQTVQGKYTPQEALDAFDKEASRALRNVK